MVQGLAGKRLSLFAGKVIGFTFGDAAVAWSEKREAQL